MVLEHTVSHILCTSIIDASTCAVLSKTVGQPPPEFEDLQQRSKQDEHTNHGQRTEDDGIEEADKLDRGFGLRGHLENCFCGDSELYKCMTDL